MQKIKLQKFFFKLLDDQRFSL